jgi:hypothetical protein
LIKAKPTSLDEMFWQTLFGNPHVPLPILEELTPDPHMGNVMVFVGCSHFKDLWDYEFSNLK